MCERMSYNTFCERRDFLNSDFHDTDEVDRGYVDAVKISLKNGRTYNVKESYTEIMRMITRGEY